jgi:hypothetical protein
VALGAAACAPSRSASPEPIAQTRGAWRVVGPMSVPRYGPSLATLSDGRVFAIGGDDYPENTAELFDPAKGTWSQLANSDPHGGAPAFAVGSSRAVLLGGTADGICLVYDFVNERWTKTKGAMVQPRRNATVTALPDGRALVVGGLDATDAASSSSEIFDPTTDSFVDAGNLKAGRAQARTTSLGDGRVVATGGRVIGTYDSIAAVETWQASKGWTTDAPMNEGRFEHVALLLGAGKVMVAGGTPGSDGATSSVEIYDVAANTWSNVHDMTTPRLRAAGARLPDGRVLVAGGSAHTGHPFSTTEIYDPVANKWTPGPDLSAPREASTMVTLANGALLLVGGEDGTANLSTAEILDLYAVGLGDAGPEVGSDAGTDVGSDGGPPVVTPGSAHACKSPSECASGFCVDGVCCESKCDAPCHSCALPDKPGKCELQPLGQDRRGECGAARTCVQTCDGAGACVSVRGGEQCAPSRCTDRSSGVGPSYCAAAGASCPDATTTFDCGAYACEAAFGACLTQCSSSDDCAAGFACDAQRCVKAAEGGGGDGGGCAQGGAPARGAIGGLGGALAIVALGALGASRRRARS